MNKEKEFSLPVTEHDVRQYWEVVSSRQRWNREAEYAWALDEVESAIDKSSAANQPSAEELDGLDLELLLATSGGFVRGPRLGLPYSTAWILPCVVVGDAHRWCDGKWHFRSEKKGDDWTRYTIGRCQNEIDAPKASKEKQ